MDTYSIRAILKKCKIKKFYVLAKSALIKLDFKQAAFVVVVNTNNLWEENPGHWCGIVVQAGGDKAITFDSYGKNIKEYGIYLPVLMTVNASQPFQADTSNSCGAWSIFFVVMISSNYSLKYFNSLFNVNTKLSNDRKVVKFVNQIKT